ncbi:nuclear transport factor 2 family protein [Candidatus Micrarchaeota archaeon]|nr:nuclear transport factor 2 family protein [Candidatus Micrarchaeota archaeon]
MVMESSAVIKKYLRALEEADSSIIGLFSPNAIVNSPLYGKVNATSFYKDLFKDTTNSKITLMNIFKGETPTVAASHFRYDWVLKNGSKTSFECVDVFHFDKNGKISELTIIYDTFKLRGIFEEMKKQK